MSENERKIEFIEYLKDTFGVDFLRTIKAPINAHFGERVIYVLSGDKAAARTSTPAEDIQEIEKFAATTHGKIVEIKPPVESNYPEPRLVDLPGWEICYKIPLKKYLDGHNPMPEEDFAIKWVLGILFEHSNNKLVLIDLLSPKVKGLFSMDYEIEEDWQRKNSTVAQLFKIFCHKLEELKEEANNRSREIEWIKYTQVEFDISMRTKLLETGFNKT